MNTKFKTPILLLIFNRPDVTQKVFDRIKLIQPKYLFVAADGPRPDRRDDVVNCSKTREIIDQVNWECEVKTLFRKENLGCGLAVCSAISWFFEQVEEGIILEDDCLPDISFFPYCSELLDRYKDDKDIYVISGMNRQNGIKRGNGSYYFSNYPITWGWGTWRRAWNKFSYDIPDVDHAYKSGILDHVFQSNNEKKYWRKKMQLVESEKKNIWDYQWRFSIWKNKGIGITPNVNLIVNIGTTNLPTHVFLKDSFREPSIAYTMSFPLVHPKKTLELEADWYVFENAFNHSFRRIIRLIKENGIISIFRYILLKLKR
jgi:hypothetical protein